MHKKIGFKSKLDDKGFCRIFVGYAIEHGGDVHQIYDLTLQ